MKNWVSRCVKVSTVLLFLLYPPFAFAHSKEAAGFVSGFVHPLFGMDHLLAMLGVGLVSARLGGVFVWSIPALFVTCMVVGGALGANGIHMPMVEWGIALSVVVLGVSVIFIRDKNILLVIATMAFVALFGNLHGHAHGAEMPESISPIFYSIGFVFSTSFIHLLGVFIGHLPERKPKLEKLPVYLGSVMAIAGCFILYGLVQG